MSRAYLFCWGCGYRLNFRSQDLEDDPWLVTDSGQFHHACLVGLRHLMAHAMVSDTETGALAALALFWAPATKPVPKEARWTTLRPPRALRARLAQVAA